MKIDNRPLGVFDSGLGGLTVVCALRTLMPEEDIIYLGDTARVPYGNKSPETIAKFAKQDARFLVERGVKAIIVACNTVSSTSISQLRKDLGEMPVINVIDAGIEACLECDPSSVIVIGTRATISSDAYKRGILLRKKSVDLLSIATPLLVPIVEEALYDHPIAEMALRFYLEDAIRAKVPDIILLGCTHYPLLRKTITKIIPEKTKIIDSAESVAKFAKKELVKLGLCALSGRKGTERFFVTDTPCNFYVQAKAFFGRDIDFPEKISLGC